MIEIDWNDKTKNFLKILIHFLFTYLLIFMIVNQVLQHVRLPLLSPKFLVGTVGSDLLIKSDEACRDLVDEAKNYLLLPQERPLMQGPRTRPRKPVRRGEVLFAGKLADFFLSEICFSFQDWNWDFLLPLSLKLEWMGMKFCQHNSLIVLVIL